MRTITSQAFRTIGAVATSALILALVVVGIQSANGTADATDTSSVSTTELEQLAATVSSETDQPPASAADRAGLRKLRADLRAARALSGDERKAALADIRKEARAGGYGPAVQRRVERRIDRRGDRRDVVRALLPDELQADLAAVREAPQDQRAGLRAQIMQDALAGEYGANVQAAAEKIQKLRDS